jgi:putative transposase
MPLTFTHTLRLKVRPESYGWLSAAAVEVNRVFNYCNEVSLQTATRTDLKRKWLSGFDLCSLTAGASQYFERIGADTIQRICVEYAQKRAAAKRCKLRWRVSRGARRSLGWIPWKAASLKRKGRTLRQDLSGVRDGASGRGEMGSGLLRAGCRGGLVAVSAGRAAEG